MMQEIYESGSIVGTFSVYEDFDTYRSGIYRHVYGRRKGGHAVKIIGWGEENGVKYWIVANSWNPRWGESGYFRIVRGENECGVETGVQTALPRL